MTGKSSGSGVDDTRDGRDETPNERYDRNWADILQELRVVLTGTQIISGFLLTLPFQQRFDELDDYQVRTYVVLVVLAAASTAFGLAPVSLHRSLFQRNVKKRTVALADRFLRITIVVVGALTVGVLMFIIDVVVGRTAGLVAAIIAAVFLLLVLLVIPGLARSTSEDGE